jgi:2-polyprenyl-3-methyl-5-hydroxy-6-metoxy-1,4-benzoquinol methylase
MRCPACGRGTVRKAMCSSQLESCRSCRSAWRSPTPSDQELARAYDSFYLKSSNSEATPAVVAEQIADYLVPSVSGSLVVLDYGCGSGTVASAFSGKGLQVIGIEPNESFAQEAKAQGVDLVGSVDEIPSSTIDLVLLVEVIEHVRHPLATLRAIRRIVKDGGRVYLSTPNRRGLLAVLSGCRWRELRNPTHLTLFSEAGLRETLRQAGFVTVSTGPYLHFSGHGRMRGALQRLLWLTHLSGGIRLVAKA